MSEYYFYKTVKDGSRNRMHALPYQVDENGSLIFTKLNCQVSAGGMKVREEYPIGTVFCSNKCELSARGGTPYIVAGDIYPILNGTSQMYQSHLPMPKREMTDAYDKYLKAVSLCVLAEKISEGIVGIVGPDGVKKIVTRQPGIMASLTGSKNPLVPISVKSVNNFDVAILEKRKVENLFLLYWNIDPEYTL